MLAVPYADPKAANIAAFFEPELSALCRLSPHIFREYSVRGIVGDTFGPQEAYAIARAFAARVNGIGPRIVCVGRDGRISSPALHAAVCRGLVDSGLDVIDIGVGPTPMLCYAAQTSAAAGGIMVTGSHAPADHNGLKFVGQHGLFCGKDLRALKSIAEAGAFTRGAGRRETVDLRDDYIRTLLKCYKGGLLNVAWDAGNGATGDIMTVLCHKLPGQHIALNAVIDGGFPVHHPDPDDPSNLKDLISVVTAHRLDAGIAFDGDGDRLSAVDDEGEIIDGSQLTRLYAAEALKENSGDGEAGRRFFFADHYPGYDALHAALRLLDLLSRSGKKLSQLRRSLPLR